MKLTQSPVLFDPDTHTYTHQGRRLSGITPLLTEKLFPGKYASIPAKVLAHAAEHGTLVHLYCETADDADARSFLPADPSIKADLEAYIEAVSEEALVHESSEYLVSDLQNYASSIDKVYRTSADTFTLADIKTTCELDTSYVSWQLSVYAYLFTRQNPGAKVDRLLAIHLRKGKASIVQVERKPDQEIERLLLSGIEGTPFIPSEPVVDEQEEPLMPEELLSDEDDILDLIRQKKDIEQRIEQYKQRLLAYAQDNGLARMRGTTLRISVTKPATRVSIDAKRLKKEQAEIYYRYAIQTEIKPTVRINT